MKKTYDVCVIGSGLVGLASAYELAKEGLAVALVESGALGAGASTANTSMLLFENTRNEAVLQMCLDGVRDFENLADELGREVGFEALNLLSFFTGEDEENTACELKALYHTMGFDDYYILPPEEVFSRQPGLHRQGVLGAALCKQWRIDPMRTTLAYFARCKALGVDWFPRSPITGFRVQGDMVAGAVTPGGTIKAGQYLVSAGAWTRRLLQTLNIDLAQYFIHGAAMVLERTSAPALQEAITCFTSPRILMERQASRNIQEMGWENMPELNANEFMIVPDYNGNLVVAQRSYASPRMTGKVPASFLRELCENVRHWLPGFETQRVIRSWITPVPFILDGQGFFGALRPYGNLAVSSGYGSVLIMAPVLGRMSRNLLTGQPQEYDVSGLDPHRFEKGAKGQ